MASLPHPIQDGSDQNCVESCNLEYGISETFDKTVLEQQKIKASKHHIIPKFFTDARDVAKFNHLMKDPLFKTFDDIW